MPSGDSPDGTGATPRASQDGFSAQLRSALPVGKLPTGAGGSPAPPIDHAKGPKPGVNMQDAFFYVFAFVTLVCGFMVIANPFSRNPVTSAMFLVLTIASLTGLFVLLHAYYLAAVQVLVYAGAVIVLFLFVIMLLDLKEETRRKIKLFGIVTGLISVGAIVCISLKTLKASDPGANLPAPQLDGSTEA